MACFCRTVKDLPENGTQKGGCRVTASAIPGIYYEKVYSKNILYAENEYQMIYLIS